MDLIKEMRSVALPWVTDWTNPQDHIRYEKDVKKLDGVDWFFCHPSAYKICWLYGTPVLLGINAAVGIMLAKIYHSKFAFFIGCLFLIVALFQSYKNYKIIKNTKDATFYDMWLRDY